VNGHIRIVASFIPDRDPDSPRDLGTMTIEQIGGDQYLADYKVEIGTGAALARGVNRRKIWKEGVITDVSRMVKTLGPWDLAFIALFQLIGEARHAGLLSGTRARYNRRNAKRRRKKDVDNEQAERVHGEH